MTTNIWAANFVPETLNRIPGEEASLAETQQTPQRLTGGNQPDLSENQIHPSWTNLRLGKKIIASHHGWAGTGRTEIKQFNAWQFLRGTVQSRN